MANDTVGKFNTTAKNISNQFKTSSADEKF